MKAMVAAGYVHGRTQGLVPQANITRAEFAQLYFNIIQSYITKSGSYAKDYKGNLLVRTKDLELANVIFARLFGSLEKRQEERPSKKESRSERSSGDTGSSSPTSRKNSKNDRPSIGEQLQSFRETLSGVEPRVPTREKMRSEITK